MPMWRKPRREWCRTRQYALMLGLKEMSKSGLKFVARTLQIWASAANPSYAVPEDQLSLNDPDIVLKWLCKFVLETRQESGKRYPPKSLYSILCGLQCINHSNGVRFNFLDKKIYGLSSYTEPLTLFLMIWTRKVLEHQLPLLLLHLSKMKIFFLMRKLCQWTTLLVSRAWLSSM